MSGKWLDPVKTQASGGRALTLILWHKVEVSTLEHTSVLSHFKFCIPNRIRCLQGGDFVTLSGPQGFPGVLGHHTSEFFSPLLRVWLWGWGTCFELWCPIFLFLKKFYFRQSPSDTMKVKLISSGNQAIGPHGTDSSCCPILSSLHRSLGHGWLAAALG